MTVVPTIDEASRPPVADRSPPDVPWPAKVDVFGLRISPTTYDEAVAATMTAARQGRPGVVSCHAVHAVVTCSGDPELRSQANAFDMITPDGQPVRWALNWLHGAGLRDRVYGPELTLRLCQAAAEQGVSIYLYGGSPEVSDALAERLGQRFPTLKIAGRESPPYRELTPEEDAAMVRRINDSGAGLVFIGLGCPKQDRFAYEHRHLLRGVQICVGAAFDFHAGKKSVAPAWMQRRGLEWAYRLGQEPRRLWKRYLATNSLFVWRLSGALLRRALSGRPDSGVPLNSNP